MGYHLTILRTEQKVRKPISQSDVEQAASAIPGWRFESGKSQLSFFVKDREIVTLWLNNGELWTKNPTEEAIRAMIPLAESMNARVRGDEFETYRTVDDTYLHPDDRSQMAGAEQEGQVLVRNAKRNQWILNISIICFFLVMAMVVSKCGSK